MLVGLLITGTLSLGAARIHRSNEGRLLNQRAREAALVVTAAVPNLQTPLASAAVLAEATNASASSFRQLMGPLVAAGLPFGSASLWAAAPAAPPRPIVSVGKASELVAQPPDTIERLLAATRGRGTVIIEDLLGSADRRLGYAYSVPGPKARYIVYAEAALPKDRRAAVDKNSAFSDLDYALYLGRVPAPQNLLASSTGGSLPRGRRASAVEPFGNSSLLLVLTAKGELGGNLLARLPWLLAGLGLILTLAGAFLVERLLRRRDHAELLARENAVLYTEQRTVAQTLQHSLLPDTLPRVPGLELAARYVSGVEGIDVGGDWYDVVRLDDGRILFVVGDVSGRGLRAATAMAELRYAVRAYAAQGDEPAVILTKVARLIDVARDGHFATALCGVLDVDGHQLTLSNAGHPDPVVVAGGEAWFAATQIDAPLGVVNAGSYNSVTVSIPPGATVLAYTDGLIERRGENLDVGRERLRGASLEDRGSVEDLLTTIVARTIPGGSADDTAILGLRWTD